MDGVLSEEHLTMKQHEIGAALDHLADDVRQQELNLTAQYRAVSTSAEIPLIHKDRMRIALIKQAVDTPHRARAQLQAWITAYNAANGEGTAQTFLAACLKAGGSVKTLASINAELAAIEAQAQTVVTNVAGGWTWDQAAAAVESAPSVAADSDFSYDRLPIPGGYVTVWGEPW